MQVDYTKFSVSSNLEEKDKNFDKKWWKSEIEDLPYCVFKVVKSIMDYDTRRQNQYLVSAKLYGNVDALAFGNGSLSRFNQTNSSVKDRVTYNVSQSALDTVVAKLGKNRPKPLFLTSGGDSKLQRKAKSLTKFVEGVFYENKAYRLGPNALRDAGVFGDGLIHVFSNGNRIKYERVIASELYTDWLESFYGNPRQLHRVKAVDRDVMIEEFPEYKDEILNAASASQQFVGGSQNVSDQITVIESWHLPSSEDASDGRHCICIDDCCVFDEEYTDCFFPFAKIPWSERLYGFWSQGGIEQIQSIQLEINKILWIIQRSMHLAGSFKVLLENGSKIVKEHLNNDVGAVITYNGTMPQYITPPIVPMELYTHLQTLKQSAYEEFGVSMLSAASKKPDGLDSGKALREFNDIESDRFMTIGHNYENFFLDLSFLTVTLAKKLYKNGVDLKVKSRSRKFIETIKWSDVDIDEDKFYMEIFPVSSLPTDPSGRLQTVQEYLQAGMMSPRTGRKLLDFPDLEQVEDLANAQEEYLQKILDKIVDDGEYTTPEPEDDLDLGIELSIQYYTQGKLNNLDDERLELLRQFNQQCQLLKQKAAEAMQPAAQPQPQGQPLPPPQSDLIKNVPGIPGEA